MGEKQEQERFDRAPADDGDEEHWDPVSLDKFIHGELAQTENLRAQKHLAGCEHCRSDLVTLLHLSVAEATEEERQLLQALPPFDSNAQIQQILRRFPQLVLHEPSREAGATANGWEWLKSLAPQPVLSPAFALALAVILAIGSFGGYRLYVGRQIHNDLAAGLRELKNNWHVSANDYRPSGDFELSLFSRTHGPAPEPAADPAVQAFQKVLQRDEKNRAAILGLAVYHSFAGRMSFADSLLQTLLQNDSTGAEVWNQRGLVLARRQQPEAALAAFATALRHRADYAEAAFNRALLLTRLERRPEAIAAWQEYLRLDPGSRWSEAAREHLQQLEPL